MKKALKSVIVTTALVTTLSTITPIFNTQVSASTTPLKQELPQELSPGLSKDNITLSEYEIANFDKYVILNQDNSYSIKNEAINELSPAEYERLNTILSNTNQKLKEISKDLSVQENFEIEILSPQNVLDEDQLFTVQTTYKEGVSKVTFHWWGMKIYLSKSLLNKSAATGITLGGIWLPSKVLASVGVLLGVRGTELYKGGIWIEQYWVAGIGPIKTLFGFDAAGWQ